MSARVWPTPTGDFRETFMLLGPQEIALRIAWKHRPGWVVWYGERTREFWALACWVRTPHAMFGAATPNALDAAMTTFETFHPKPRHQHRRPR